MVYEFSMPTSLQDAWVIRTGLACPQKGECGLSRKEGGSFESYRDESGRREVLVGAVGQGGR